MMLTLSFISNQTLNQTDNQILIYLFYSFYKTISCFSNSKMSEFTNDLPLVRVIAVVFYKKATELFKVIYDKLVELLGMAD